MARPAAWDVGASCIRLLRKHVSISLVRKAAMDPHDGLFPHDSCRKRGRRAMLLDEPVDHVVQATQVISGSRRQHHGRDQMRPWMVQKEIDPRQSRLQFDCL